MPNRDEHAITGLLGDSAGADVAQADPGDDGRLMHTENFFDDAVPDDVDLWVAEQPILQDFLRPQRVAAMNKGHPPRMIGQINRLLDRGISTPDHDDVLAAEEKSVTGGTCRHAKAAEDFLARQTKPPGLGKGRDDHRITG